MRSDGQKWNLAALFALCLLITSCSKDVTADPHSEKPQENTAPAKAKMALSPKRDSARYEFVLEQRSLGAKTSVETAEGEIYVQFTKFQTGRVRATFRVSSVDARRGANLDALSPNQELRNRLEGLTWSTKHDPTGTVIGNLETKESDELQFLRTLGAARGFFGLSYPAQPVKEGESWRTATPGAEWQLAGITEWLATLEGVYDTRIDDSTLGQSIRARIEISSGLPLEIVGDETLTRPDDTTVTRHWSLSLID